LRVAFFSPLKNKKMSVVEIIKDRDGQGVKYQVQCPETDLLSWHWIHYSNLDYLCDEEFDPMQLANISQNNLIDLLNNHHDQV
jgi:hypothetical protein